MPTTTNTGPMSFRLTNPTLRYSSEWLYTVSYFLLVIILLALSSTLPIDIIVQSKTYNSHLATNTIIILIIVVHFIVFAIVLHALRLLFNKVLMQDIPKSYIPITKQDIGERMNQVINDELIRTQYLKEQAKPKGQVIHPGMYHKSKFDKSANENDLEYELPDNLIYENIIKVIGQELKYNNTLTLNDNRVLNLSNRFTIREELNKAFKSNNSNLEYGKLENFLNLYEKLRYSGEPISLPEFKQFLKDWNYIKSTI